MSSDISAGGRLIAAIVIGVLAVAVTACATSAPSGSRVAHVTPAVAAQLAEVTTTPFKASDADWAIMASTALTKHIGHPLTAGGKPEVLYVGTEFCPYCAAENWVLRAHRGAVAQAIIGAADYITAELCTLTRDRPATACPASIKAFSGAAS